MSLNKPSTAIETRHPYPVWIPLLAVSAAILVWCLTAFDAAIPYLLQFFILETGWREGLIYLALLVVFGGIQWMLFRLKQAGWLALLPIVITVLGFVYGEFLWVKGGWDRIGGAIICGAALLIYFGTAIATLLKVFLQQKKVIKQIALTAVAVLFVAAFLLWPRPLNKVLTFEFGTEVLFFDETGDLERREVRDEAQLADYLSRCKVSPCLTAPQWLENRGLLVRLSAQYILRAPHGDTPYIYRYTGPLEDFDGSAPCFIMWAHSELYVSLRTVCDWS